MHIALITPYGAETKSGNWHTAARWAGFLRNAGHRVDLATHWNGESVDLMIALHARRSALSIQAFAAWQPDSPLVVVLTGTDIYRDIHTDEDAKKSLQLATRLVVLQDMALQELEPSLREKTSVVYQSAPAIAPQPKPTEHFDVLVIGHLREEKDPFRAALASALLPSTSRVRITHLGNALSPEMGQTAREIQGKYSHWEWAGGFTHEEIQARLTRAHLLINSSNMEGGSNAICEALAADVPVIASNISGNIGMLGKDYPGYFPVGDEHALANLITKAETDKAFYADLLNHCRQRRQLMFPELEAAAIQRLVTEVKT